jgi:hypothetical protein
MPQWTDNKSLNNNTHIYAAGANVLETCAQKFGECQTVQLINWPLVYF